LRRSAPLKSSDNFTTASQSTVTCSKYQRLKLKPKDGLEKDKNYKDSPRYTRRRGKPPQPWINDITDSPRYTRRRGKPPQIWINDIADWIELSMDRTKLKTVVPGERLSTTPTTWWPLLLKKGLSSTLMTCFQTRSTAVFSA